MGEVGIGRCSERVEVVGWGGGRWDGVGGGGMGWVG